jgi:hypothetical protein
VYQPLAAETPLHVEAEVIATLRTLSSARKLELARDMNRMTDRQWRDVQAILRVQDDALDLAYLHQWADELVIAELLEWALKGQQPLQPGDEPRQQRLL